MSLSNYFETLEFADFEELTEEYFIKTLSYAKALLVGYDENIFFNTKEEKKENYNNSIRSLIWKNSKLNLTDKELLDKELNAYITLNLKNR